MARAAETGRRPEPPEPGPGQPPAEEIEVLLLEEGSVIFSWNTPDIQALAGLLGELEFETSPWCG